VRTLSMGRLTLAGLVLAAATASAFGQGVQRLERVEAAPKKSGLSAWTESLGTGMKKFADAVTPKTPVRPAPDATSLASRAKPGPELYLAVAHSYEETGKIRAAEDQFKRLFHNWPNHLEGMLAYARFLDRQDRMSEAVAVYKKAAQAHPKEPAVPNALGLCYAEHNMFAEAVPALQAAVALAPKQAVYRNNLALVFVEMGRTEDAYTQLRALQDEATSYYNLGFLLQKTGRQAEAAGCFATALVHNPKLAEAQVWLDHLRSELAAARTPTLADRRGSGVDYRGPTAPPEGQATGSQPARAPLPESQPPTAPVPGPPSVRTPERPPVVPSEPVVTRLPAPDSRRPAASWTAEPARPIGSREVRPAGTAAYWSGGPHPGVAPLPPTTGPVSTPDFGTRNTPVVYPLPPVDPAPPRR